MTITIGFVVAAVLFQLMLLFCAVDNIAANVFLKFVSVMFVVVVVVVVQLLLWLSLFLNVIVLSLAKAIILVISTSQL